MSASDCRSCGQALRWGITTHGARMPLDPEPTSRGTVWINTEGALRVLNPYERARAIGAGETLWMPHHATCPARARHEGVSRDQISLGL